MSVLSALFEAQERIALGCQWEVPGIAKQGQKNRT